MSTTPDIQAVHGGHPGEVLRKAREQQGLSLPDAARQLNLTTSALGYLEGGQFERLPGNTFARGYIRAYARLVGLDAAQLVAEFDRLTGSDASGAEVRNLNRIAEPQRLSKTVLKLVSAGLLLLLILLGYYLWQEAPEPLGRLGNLGGLRQIEVDKANGTTEVHRIDEGQSAGAVVLPLTPVAVPETEPAVEAPPLSIAAPAPAVTTASGERVQPLPLQTGTPVVPTGRLSVAGLQTLAAQPAPPSLQVSEPRRAQPAEPETPSIQVPAGQGLLQADFNADCWLQITDGRGKVIFSGIKRKGEKLELSGQPPLQLHLGNAMAVELRYNGQPVEKTNVSSGGTARLKLGQ